MLKLSAKRSPTQYIDSFKLSLLASVILLDIFNEIFYVNKVTTTRRCFQSTSLNIR